MGHPTVHIQHLENVLWLNGAQCTHRLNNTTDVWRISISSFIPQINELSKLLAAGEQERAGRYYREQDKERFIVSRAALRILLGRYLNLDAKQIVFATGQNKKPHIKDNDVIHYNVSHSGNYVLVAISASAVGIDVEFLDSNMQYADIMQVSYSAPEIDYVTRSTSPLQAFYTIWTRKEALLKATAKGIDDGLKLIPGTDGLHATMYNTIGSQNSWLVHSFNIDDEHLGSIASASSSLTFWDLAAI